MFEIDPPQTREEILAGLERLEEEITTFMRELPDEEFVAPQSEFWSPEGHLRHLAKSVRVAAGAMRVAKILLRLRFGRPLGPSRSYDEVVALYRGALAKGATAGPFTPSDRPDDVPEGEWKRQVIDRWRQASASLLANTRRWKDPALDRYLLPHPLLGKMTVREILFFTLYHNAHHARRVAERRSA